MAPKKRNAKRKKPNAAQKAASWARSAKQTAKTTRPSNGPRTRSAPSEAAPGTVDGGNSVGRREGSPTGWVPTRPKATKSVLYSLRIEEELRDAFNASCQQQDMSGSQVLRRYMRAFIAKYSGDHQGEA